MQRVPRLVAVVAVTFVAGIAVAGCRAQPSVAAYVGKTEFTEDRVTELVDNARDEIKGNATLKTPTRSEVLTTLVLNKVCEDQLKTQPTYKTPEEVTPATISQGEGFAVAAEFTKIRAQLWTCLSGVQPTSSAPTEAKLREAYERGVASGDFSGEYTFEKFTQEVTSKPQISSYFQMEQALEQAASASDVVINPRYRPLEFPVLPLNSGTVLVAAGLSDDPTVPVSDHR